MPKLTLAMPKPVWIDSKKEAYKLIDKLSAEPLFAVDTETTGLSFNYDSVVFWSAATETERWTLSRHMLQYFRHLFEDPNQIIVGHNYYMFDYHMIRNSGIVTHAQIHDTLVMNGIPGIAARMNQNSLKACVRAYFNRLMPEYKDTFGKVPMQEIEDAGTAHKLWMTLVDYASRDAWETLMLYYFLQAELQGWYCDLDDDDGEARENPERTLWDHYLEYEVPFSKLLAEITYYGVQVDVGHLFDLKPEFEGKMEKLHTAFVAAAGEDVNLNSPLQLRKLFYGKLKREAKKFTDGGTSGNRQPSTDVEVIRSWAGEGCELSKKLIEYRKYAKLKGTYVNGLLKRLGPDDRVRTRLIQGGAATGRLASRDPNLQNIPIRSKEGRRIREAFVPSPGFIFIDADYAQLEMRIIADFSEDENMIAAILGGMDLHCFTVSLVDGIPYEEVVLAINRAKGKCPHCGRVNEGDSIHVLPGNRSCDSCGLLWSVYADDLYILQRRGELKSAGFGILYGETAVGLGEGLGLPVQIKISKRGYIYKVCPDGDLLIRQYFEAYPSIKDWVLWSHAKCEDQGFVQSFLGRYRWIAEINADTRSRKNMGKRMAQNTPIQATAADITKAAQIRVWEDTMLRDMGYKMQLQIHDEILGEMPEDGDVAFACARIKMLMEDPFKGRWHPRGFRVPITAEVATGYSWGEAH